MDGTVSIEARAAVVSFVGVSKRYGRVEVLGPSGSGKTTILRLLGGFAQPSCGRIVFRGRDISRLPPHRRPFNTVFQDYALFPHMNVARNVGYGLRVTGVPARAAAPRVEQALGTVGLHELADRAPNQLSGGQRQRVALARAIVCEPEIVLLDEPLGALDAEMRRQMQVFLKQLQRRIGTTFLFVTHDQEEAISMSDRIVVMRAGGIEQVGTPAELYYAPRTRFVAGFFGDNNLVPGRVSHSGGGMVRVETALGVLEAAGAHGVGVTVDVAIRPEKLQLGGGEAMIRARVTDIVFSGSVTRVLLAAEADGSRLEVKLMSDPARVGLQVGDPTVLGVDARDAVAVVPT